jgi:hypothetical protein
VPRTGNATRRDNTSAVPRGVVVAHVDAPALAAGAQRPHDPFSAAGMEAQTSPFVARPWPRSVLGYPSQGTFSASYGTGAAAQNFHPFEPQLPGNTQAEPQAQPQSQP